MSVSKKQCSPPPPPCTTVSFLHVSLLSVLSLLGIVFFFTACDLDSIGSEVDVTVTNTAEWNDAFARIAGKINNLSHTITIDGSFDVPAVASSVLPDHFLPFANHKSCTLTLRGSGILSFTGEGAMLAIGQDQHLILDGNITLMKKPDNNKGLRGIVLSGRLTMNSGIITGAGGGVYVPNPAGSFTMNGGSIIGNTRYGVEFYGDSFIMNGGTIAGNTESGVLVGRGSFTMNSGAILGNKAPNYGGGVLVSGTVAYNRSFTKTGGVIYGNDAAEALENTAGDTSGHAVYYYSIPDESNYTAAAYYRDTTLGENDDISTTALPSTGTGLNWTKKK